MRTPETTLNCNLTREQLAVLHKKLTQSMIPIDTPFEVFKNALTGVPMSAMKDMNGKIRTITWLQNQNLLALLLFGFGNGKYVNNKKYKFNGILNDPHHLCGKKIAKIFSFPNKKGKQYITALITPLSKNRYTHGLEKLMPAVEYIKNVRKGTDRETPNPVNQVEEIEEKKTRLVEVIEEPKTEDMLLNRINYLVEKVEVLEKYLKIKDGLDFDEAARYLGLELGDLCKLVVFKKIKTNENNRIPVEELERYGKQS